MNPQRQSENGTHNLYDHTDIFMYHKFNLAGKTIKNWIII